MRPTILNIFNKFLFASLFLVAFSVQVSAQGNFSARSAVINNSPADTIIIQNSDGSVEKRIIKRNTSTSQSPAQNNIKMQSPDGAKEQQIIRSAAPATYTRADTIEVELPNGNIEQRIIYKK